MKFIKTTLLLLLLFFSFTNFLFSGDYSIDDQHSFITFKIRHFNTGWVLGTFNDFSGEIYYDASNIEKAAVTVFIKPFSIDTGVPERDFHLRTADFLDTMKYTEMTFKSNKITKVDEGRFKIFGKLILKDISKDVILEAKYLNKIQDHMGNERIGFIAETKLNRFDFGINWDMKMPDGKPMVGETIFADFYIEATKINHNGEEK